MAKEDKVIVINATNSIVEGNLVEIPFIYFGRGKDKPTLVTYHWTDSNGNECVIDVEGSKKYGLPTPYEFDVLLALLRIRAMQKPIRYDQNILDDKLVDPDDLNIEFTLSEIARQLGKADSGTVLKRIQIALNTLANTRFTVINKQVFYDKARGTHLTSEDGNVSGIFNNYRWKSKQNKKGEAVSEKSSIKMNEFFYRSIINSYFKYFNYTDYLKLGKNNVAKRMFLLLCKWRNGKNKQVINLTTLYERLPLDDDKPAYKKNEIIKNAATALQKADVIKSFKIANRQITFNYHGTTAAEKELETLLTKYNLFTQVQERLIELQFTQEEIMHVMNCFFTDLEYCKALLRYTDYQIAHQRIKDAKTYILKGLEKKYNIEKCYYDKNLLSD